MSPIKIVMSDDLRNLIRTKRKKLGMSGVTLSQLINQKSSYIAAIENGRIRKMSLESLKQVIKILFSCDDSEAEAIIKMHISKENNIHFAKHTNDNNINVDTSSQEFANQNIKKYKTGEDHIDTVTLDDLVKNMKIGFETMQKHDSEFVVSTLKRLVTSMHFDLGFMMALFHIPYFVLNGLTHEERQKFLNDVSDIFKKYAIISEEHIESKKNKESAAEDDTSDGTPDDSVDEQTKN